RDNPKSTGRQWPARAGAKGAGAGAGRAQALGRLPLESLEQSVKLAKRRLERTEILAPVGGTVLKVVAHEGEATGGQPILHLAGAGGMGPVAGGYETDGGLRQEGLQERGEVSADVST